VHRQRRHAERLALGLTDTLAALPHARWPLAEVTGPPLPVLADISIIDMLNAGLSKIAPAKDG
jgi:hypothetical protein